MSRRGCADRFTSFSTGVVYCQTLEALTVTTFEIEHIVPRVASGETVFENLCLACPSCNRHKAHRQAAPDPLSGDSVPLFQPFEQIWSEHFVWSEDGTRIDGVTAAGRATIEALRINRPQLVRVRRLWRILGEHPADVG